MDLQKKGITPSDFLSFPWNVCLSIWKTGQFQKQIEMGWKHGKTYTKIM
jgi:hypothetical protein